MRIRRLRAAALALSPLSRPRGKAQTDFYDPAAPRVSPGRPGPAAPRAHGRRDHVPAGGQGHTIWGDVVPYGQVWRAGANENTVITFNDPVTVEGQALPAKSYGVHALPSETSFIVIFSKNATSWGSFSYDEEDALRVTVKPVPTDMHEADVRLRRPGPSRPWPPCGGTSSPCPSR
jgi:hypothetical protein